VLCVDTLNEAQSRGAVLRAGEVLSGCEGYALALMRLDRAFGRQLSVDGRPAHLAPADWLLPALTQAPSATI
jgi:hypothetical protein